ncbi:MAG: ZIP family metal transporter [bacterium]|nr:ZIP family metal transporter [bacterium]
MTALLYALLSGLLISGIAFVGFFALALTKRELSKILAGLVAFAAGTLLGGAFFHLLPESIENGGPTFGAALVGIVAFFILDSLIWIYHCHGGHQLHETTEDHHGSCPIKPVGYLNLIGDAVHNITDGIIIGSTFLVSIPLGIVASIAVALHEIPQEMSDYGILLHSGFKKKTALLLNFGVALTILIGILAVFLAQELSQSATLYTIPFSAGGFIYIACTNLLSEIKEESKLKKRVVQTLFFISGILLMFATKTWLL